MKSKNINAIKNALWAVCIAVSLCFLIIGLLFASFHKYKGESVNTGLADLSQPVAEEVVDLSSDALGSGNARGELHTLNEIPDVGEGYLYKLTFLIDSTFINLRDLGLVDKNQVWATSSGSMKMETLPTANIVYPNDGSVISPVNAAMVKKPEILVVAIGTDGLAAVDENTFITNYDQLIKDIMSASPETSVICCGLPSVIPGYNGNDGLNVSVISDGNDWVQMVCRDTGAYFLNVQEELSESVQLLSKFAGSNGKTLNRSGIEAFLSYIRTHALQ